MDQVGMCVGAQQRREGKTDQVGKEVSRKRQKGTQSLRESELVRGEWGFREMKNVQIELPGHYTLQASRIPLPSRGVASHSHPRHQGSSQLAVARGSHGYGEREWVPHQATQHITKRDWGQGSRSQD